MKLPTRGIHQRENLELAWFYQQSAADVGLSAAGLEPAIIVTPGAVAPSASQMAAAQRQRRVRRALAVMPLRQQALLEACYAELPGMAHFGDTHGAGTGAILRAMRQDSDSIKELNRLIIVAKKSERTTRKEDLRAHLEQLSRDIMVQVRAAHVAYVDIRRQHREGEIEAADSIDAASLQVLEYRRVEKAPNPHKERVAEIAALLLELGFDD